MPNLASRPLRALPTKPKGSNPGRPAGLERLADGVFKVRSWSDPKAEPYLVNVGIGSCTCPDHTIRGRICKHLLYCGYESE